jgi:hypothetical protein
MLFPRKSPQDLKYELEKQAFIRKSPGDERKDALVDREILEGLKRIEDKIDKMMGEKK